MGSVPLHLSQRNIKSRRCCHLAIITCGCLLALLIVCYRAKGSEERIVATRDAVGATKLELKETLPRTEYCHSSISSLFCMSEAVRLSLRGYFLSSQNKADISVAHHELEGTSEESDTEDDGHEYPMEDVVEASSMFLEDEGHGRDLRFISREGPYTRRRRGFFGTSKTRSPSTTPAPVVTPAPVPTSPTDPVETPAPAISPSPDGPTAAPATTSGPAGPTDAPATTGPAGPTAAPATSGPAGPTVAPATTGPAGPTRAPSPTTAGPAGPTTAPATTTSGPAGPTAAPATTTTGPAGPTRAPSTTTSSPAGTTTAPAAPSTSTSSPASGPTTAPAAAAAASMTRNIFDHDESPSPTVIEP